MLDWTDRQMKADKVGSIPAESAGILERLECGPETWVDLVKNFRKRFRNEAGLQKNRQGFRAARRQARATRPISENA